MGHRPTGGSDKFVSAWPKRSEIRFVAPSRLINHGIKLEMNLVQSASKMNYQRLYISPSHDPWPESVWQAPPEELRRPGVQPVLVKAEVLCHSIPRHKKQLWERLGRAKLAVLGDGYNIDILGSPSDEAKRHEGRASHNDYFLTSAERSELLCQRAEDALQALRRDLHRSRLANFKMLNISNMDFEGHVPRLSSSTLDLPSTVQHGSRTSGTLDDLPPVSSSPTSAGSPASRA